MYGKVQQVMGRCRLGICVTEEIAHGKTLRHEIHHTVFRAGLHEKRTIINRLHPRTRDAINPVI